MTGAAWTESLIVPLLAVLLLITVLAGTAVLIAALNDQARPRHATPKTPARTGDDDGPT